MSDVLQISDDGQLENRFVGAEEALEQGTAGEIVPNERFAARFYEYGQSLTQLSPITAA